MLTLSIVALALGVVVRTNGGTPDAASPAIEATAACPTDAATRRPPAEVCTIVRFAMHPDPDHEVRVLGAGVGPDNGLDVLVSTDAAGGATALDLVHVDPVGIRAWTLRLADDAPRELPGPALLEEGSRVRAVWAHRVHSRDAVDVVLSEGVVDRGGAPRDVHDLTPIEARSIVAVARSGIAVLHATSFGQTMLAAWDVDGTERWTRPVDGVVDGDDPASVAFVADDVVVVTHAVSLAGASADRSVGEQTSSVTDIDAAGELRWRASVPQAGGQLSVGADADTIVLGVNNVREPDAVARPQARLEGWTRAGIHQWTQPLDANGVGDLIVSRDGITSIETKGTFEGGSSWLVGRSSAGAPRGSVRVGDSYLDAYGITSLDSDDRGGLVVTAARFRLARPSSRATIFGPGTDGVSVVLHLTGPAGEGSVGGLDGVFGA